MVPPLGMPLHIDKVLESEETTARAERELQQLIDDDPTIRAAWYFRALMAEKRGDLGRARELLERGLASGEHPMLRGAMLRLERQANSPAAD